MRTAPQLLTLVLIAVLFVPAARLTTAGQIAKGEGVNTAQEITKIYLNNGRVLEMDEITETSDRVYYKYRSITAHLDCSEIRRIEKGRHVLYESDESILSRLSTTNLPKLPSGFLGHNIQAIYAILSRNQKALVKSEFETTADYTARVRGRISSLSLLSGKKVTDEITFVVPLTPQYDADSGVLTFAPDTSQKSIYAADVPHYVRGAVGNEWQSERPAGFMEVETISVTRSYKTLGDAVGENAFGVTRRFSRDQIASFLIAMPGKSFRLPQGGIKVQMGGIRAQQLKRRAAAAVSGRIIYPYFIHKREFKSATLRNPAQVIYDDYHVAFMTEKVQFFDRATGEVIAALNLR